MNRTARIIICLVLFMLLGPVGHAQWVRTSAAGNDSVTSLAVTGTTLYAGTYGKGVQRSTDRGGAWTAMNNGLTDDTVLALAATGSYVFAGTYNGGFHSTNGGGSWTQLEFTFGQVQSVAMIDTFVFISTLQTVERTTVNIAQYSLAGGFSSGTDVRSLIVSPTNYVYAGTTDGVYRSTDFGVNFSKVGLSGNIVQSFVINYPEIFAGTVSNGLYLSVNDGSTWVTDTGMVSSNIQALSMSDPYLIAGVPEGVYLSSDYGVTWQLFNSGLTNLDIKAFAVGDSDLYAATMGAGVWRRPLSEMVTDVAPSSARVIPQSFSLAQNHPNPFNPSTTIKFSLPRTTSVVLKVYSILGQEVATLVNGKVTAGFHEVTWNAGNAPSGVYLYRLVAGDWSETRKMILLR